MTQTQTNPNSPKEKQIAASQERALGCGMWDVYGSSGKALEALGSACALIVLIQCSAFLLIEALRDVTGSDPLELGEYSVPSCLGGSMHRVEDLGDLMGSGYGSLRFCYVRRAQYPVACALRYLLVFYRLLI